LPSYVFLDKRHSEDAYYSRLAIGFFQEEYKRQIPLRFNNPELEAIKGIAEWKKRKRLEKKSSRGPFYSLIYF